MLTEYQAGCLAAWRSGIRFGRVAARVRLEEFLLLWAMSEHMAEALWADPL